MKDLDQLIYVQLIYVAILVFILWKVRKQQKLKIVYWSIIGAYILVIGWLINIYSTLGPRPDPGRGFAWAMATFIYPGALALAALLIFIVAGIMKSRR